MLQIPELLAPAGDLERLRYAINYGADAVYCALPEFGMRSAPTNFTPEQLTEGVIYAHARGRKVYLTMNTLPTNEEADRLPEAIKEAAKAGVDAFIVADLGVLDACKTFAPDIDVHLSTQTGITNWAAARAAYKMGAKRVVLAREMTLQDIAILRDKTPPELEIEAFVHGAMCMSVSGRCLLSNYMAGRDANRGQCAQPCRWKYYLSEETRPGQLYEIGENENGSYILNANDLCTAPFIDLICKAGVDSLKIEGRAKTFYYVASVTAAYRKALETPADENMFRQLRLNQWVKQSTRWMQMDKWDACSFAVNEEELLGRECYGGLDLSSSTDITAFVLVFPPRNDTEKYVILPYFWIPEDNMRLRVRRDHVPYDVWAAEGCLKTTEGNVIHYGFIEQFIDELGTKFHIKEIAFDRWGAVQMVQNLEGMGFTVVPFGQGYKDMSPPTKELMKLTLEERIAHGGHKVLRWMMDNVFVRQDPAGNIKMDKEKSTEKIDGAVATVMALDRAIRNEGSDGSVYDDRGILVF